MSLILSGTDGLSDVDGSAATPAIRGTDANTGIFFPAADTIAFSEGGVESMRIDSAGNVGIGTVSPQYRVHAVSGSLTSPAFYAGSSQSNGYTLFADAYNTNQALTTIGVSFSNAAQVLGSCVKPSTTVADAFLSSQDAFASFGAAISINGGDGNIKFLVGASSATTTVNTSKSLTERMRIDSSGNVCIGGTTADQTFNVVGKRSWFASNSSPYSIKVAYSTVSSGFWLGSPEANALAFSNDAGTERMRITSGGDVYIARTSDVNTDGFTLAASGFLRSSTTSFVCAVFNRNTTDGELISFRQDGTAEGNISVSGTTVSYNGGHLARWSQLPDNSKDDTILKGTVLANLDDMCVWTKDGEQLPNEQLNKMKVSDVEGDTNVAGVFVNWTFDEQCQSDDMNVAMTGDMIIRIAEGVVVQKGDLLISAGDGTAKPQNDDIRRSSTVAKVTSNHVTCTYEDGSYCVPCVLMAC